jgi:two-component system, sensor histidine kinase and response regulator
LYLVRGNYEQAVELLEQSWGTYLESDLRVRIGNLLATAYRYQGQYAESLEIYQEVLDLVREDGDRRMEAGIETNIAVVYQHMGAEDQAMERYVHGLEIFEEIADTTNIVLTLNHIGELYREEGNPERALPFYSESLDLAGLIDAREDIARARYNMGLAFMALERYDEALDEFEEALRLSEEGGNINRPVQILHSRGTLYLSRGDLDRAESSFRQSMDASRKQGIAQGIYHNSIGLGNLARERGEYDEAREYYRQAHDLALGSGSAELQLQPLENLWRLSEQTGEYEAAFEYLKEYQELRESLLTSEREQALARYETLLDLRSERRQMEMLELEMASRTQYLWLGLAGLIILLVGAVILWFLFIKQRQTTRQLEERKSELVRLYNHVEDQRVRLSELNETKVKLFSILAHDLRRPVAQMQGLVMLLRDGAVEEADREELFSRVEDDVKQSLSTLEDYLQWAQSQLEGIDPDLKPVSLSRVVDRVMQRMQPTANEKSISLVNRCEKSAYVLADEQMTSVILENLISNAVKFSHPEDEVTVSLDETPSEWMLNVIDSGIGIPAELQDRLFSGLDKSRSGTGKESGTGIGLMICREFVERQGGEIFVKSREGKGTTISFRLPKYSAEKDRAGTTDGTESDTGESNGRESRTEVEVRQN